MTAREVKAGMAEKAAVMNTPTEPVHSPFGGSSAQRILNCPASAALITKVPANLRTTSAYAQRGTACHAVMAELIANDADERALGQFVGKKFGDYTVTNDDIENAVRPAVEFALPLLDTPGAEFYLEHRVVFPGIADTFGTTDLLVRIRDTVHVVDWKFGSGVSVSVLYPKGDEDIINSQLLFYGAAARHSLPDFFVGVSHIALTICQPVTTNIDDDIVSTVTVSHDELDEFISLYRGACAEALGSDPRMARGPWCRFCLARPICPLHTAPLLDLAQFELLTPSAAPSRQVYLQMLADGLNLVEAVTEISTALRDEAKRALQAGEVVPDYALSAGRAFRSWRDEANAQAELQKLGLDPDDLVVKTMRSPKQVEIRAKARGLKIPTELIASTRSGVSLVRAENARAPVPGRDELARSFSAALKALQGGGST